jgi:membrane fusion protein, multidrug efflux system
VIKSDDEHGKKGPDGKYHDAFLPANFKVHRGAKVVVTVLNYDDMPHSFTAAKLHVNAFFMMGSAKKPSKTTFTFKAKHTGRFAWHCNPKCDSWSMKHWGFMKGHVKVVA